MNQSAKKRPFMFRVLCSIVRHVYHFQLVGQESLYLDEDTPCVFIANHGEVVGPLALALFLPYPFRSWSNYELTDRKAVIPWVMDGVFQNYTGWKRVMLLFLMKLFGASLVCWVFRAIDCIPIYRNRPEMFVSTLRASVKAMEAGDHLLIFPESTEHTPGHRYLAEGVSEFFRGFAAVGQMYEKRTGKSPLFVPVYVNGKQHTISFGTPVRYNPANASADETERLCLTLREELLRLST